MAHIYISAPEHQLVAQIAGELLGDGFPPRRIRVYSAHPQDAPELPVGLVRYRSPGGAMTVGGIGGAAVGALIGLPLLVYGGFGLAPMLVTVVAGGVAGALIRLWFANGLGGELYRLDDSLQAGQVVMAVDVEKPQIGEIERRVKNRHPEVLVHGTDPEGTPPFP